MTLKDLLVYKHSKREWKTNAYNIPITQFNLDKEGAHEFNEILKLIVSCNLPQIKRTPSGGISNYRVFNKYNCYDFRWTSICAEITLLTLDGCWRFQCRTTSKACTNKGRPIYGSTCLKEFKEICKSVGGIDLEDYATTDGMEIKKEWKSKEKAIYKKQIWPESLNLVDKTLMEGNVHHIDLCSGFQSGLVRAFPEFYEPCKKLYDLRKVGFGPYDSTAVKMIQVASIGAMWSDQRQAKYIRLAKGAIEENNRLLMNLVHRLRTSGRKVLLLNTDGIWYQGDIFHDFDEKADLGGWKNDHVNCTKFRMKNNSTYEFVENGKYTAVMSGLTSLDLIKPDRDEWEWGDIYKTAPLVYTIDKEGIKDSETGELL